MQMSTSEKARKAVMEMLAVMLLMLASGLAGCQSGCERKDLVKADFSVTWELEYREGAGYKIVHARCDAGASTGVGELAYRWCWFNHGQDFYYLDFQAGDAGRLMTHDFYMYNDVNEFKVKLQVRDAAGDIDICEKVFTLTKGCGAIRE